MTAPGIERGAFIKNQVNSEVLTTRPFGQLIYLTLFVRWVKWVDAGGAFKSMIFAEVHARWSARASSGTTPLQHGSCINPYWLSGDGKTRQQ